MTATKVPFNIVKGAYQPANDAPAKIAMQIVQNGKGYITDDKGKKIDKITGKSWGSYILHII